jgi:dual specificity protein kinase YAK1
MQFVVRLTADIIQTFERCHPEFKYSETLNPKRFLTHPSTPAHNNGVDNANWDLILYVNLELVNETSNRRFIVKEMLGQGTFGQVVKCWDTETNDYVAVKVIKNQPAFYQQAIVEVSLLRTLNQKFDPDDQHNIVRMLDYLTFQNHLCIAFEMLGQNLYELLKRNHLRGLKVKYVQAFSKQILDAMIVMRDGGIIHCDLKPENILLAPTAKTAAAVKVIDFGSACMEGKTVYSYIQVSRSSAWLSIYYCNRYVVIRLHSC